MSGATPCTHGPNWRLPSGDCQGCVEAREHAEWLLAATPERIVEVWFNCCDHHAGRSSWVCKGCLDEAVKRAFEAGFAQGVAKAKP